MIPRRAVATATAFSAAVMACALPTAHSGGVTGADLDEVVVNARRIPLAGAPRAASEGTVFAEQIRHRPLLRTGELLEVVPGLVVTQHTGDGKANQYFLRGFNQSLAAALRRQKPRRACFREAPARLGNHGAAEVLFNLGKGAKLRWRNAGHFNGCKSIAEFLQARRRPLILRENRPQHGIALIRRHRQRHRFIRGTPPAGV